MIVVVGAGLAGLAAADELSNHGLDVAVVEKSVGVGGRMATRRIGDAVFDHGAQFFTVRGERFGALVERARTGGVVDVWCHGFADTDGHPRYYCPGGMTALAKWLATELADRGVGLTFGERIEHLGVDGGVVALRSEGRSIAADAVVVTAPVPQALEILSDLGDLGEPLRSFTFEPTLAVLAVLDRPPAVPDPGGVQLPEGRPFTFIADNQRKGISPVPALTLHVDPTTSRERYDDDPDIVTADLLDEASPWLGDASVVTAQLKRWRYAMPTAPSTETHALAIDRPSVVLAGDSFAGARLEGAFDSGVAAAEEVVTRLTGVSGLT